MKEMTALTSSHNEVIYFGLLFSDDDFVHFGICDAENRICLLQRLYHVPGWVIYTETGAVIF